MTSGRSRSISTRGPGGHEIELYVELGPAP